MATRTTLCFTGMDAADEAALKDLFARANARLGGRWSLAPEADADTLVVDVDSIYGHMTWLKVHNSGRTVVALSSSAHAEADRVLLRPVNEDALATLMAEIEGAAPPAPRAAAPAATPAPAAPAPTPEPAPAPAAPAPVAASPAPAAPAPEPEPEPEPQPAPDPMLADYLQPGALPGPVKLELAGAPPLALDPQSRQYVGPAALKPLIPYCRAVIHREDWVAITPAELEKLKATGTVHPSSRLLWLFALVHGEGQLAAGYDAQKKFRLLKWPQIEREYPKHFRIATVMMKRPATLAEIAEQSGATPAEVADFVNAYLAIGTAEMEEPPAPVEAAQQKSGFLGRLRSRSGA